MLRKYRTIRKLLTTGNGQTKARYDNIIRPKEQGYPPDGISFFGKSDHVKLHKVQSAKTLRFVF